MPSIRLPASAEPLLLFCRRYDEPADNACFDTYADLFTFASACGFHRLHGRKPDDPKSFLPSINPIDLAVFKNQQLFPNLLLIGLGCEQKADVARDEEKLCRLAEAFADVGFKHLAYEMNTWTPARFHLEIAGVLTSSVHDVSDPKI